VLAALKSIALATLAANGRLLNMVISLP
jgi:hypothetical protein